MRPIRRAVLAEEGVRQRGPSIAALSDAVGEKLPSDGLVLHGVRELRGPRHLQAVDDESAEGVRIGDFALDQFMDTHGVAGDDEIQEPVAIQLIQGRGAREKVVVGGFAGCIRCPCMGTTNSGELTMIWMRILKALCSWSDFESSSTSPVFFGASTRRAKPTLSASSGKRVADAADDVPSGDIFCEERRGVARQQTIEDKVVPKLIAKQQKHVP